MEEWHDIVPNISGSDLDLPDAGMENPKGTPAHLKPNVLHKQKLPMAAPLLDAPPPQSFFQANKTLLIIIAVVVVIIICVIIYMYMNKAKPVEPVDPNKSGDMPSQNPSKLDA